MKDKFKEFFIPILLIFVLLFEWMSVFFLSGSVKIVCWWTITFGSLFFLLMLILTAIHSTFKIFKKQTFKKSKLLSLIFLIFLSLPSMWSLDLFRISYPAQIKDYSPTLTISSPFKIDVITGWGGDDLSTNRPHSVVPCEKWAYDLILEPYSTNSSNLNDYGIYDLKLYSPIDAEVVGVFDKENDIEPNTDEFESMVGNYIYLKVDETNTYLILSHLKKDSVSVNIGDKVKTGDFLGKIGNSGSTSEPHLHIHHQRQNPNKTHILLAEGLPLYFKSENGKFMPKGGEFKEVIKSDFIQ